MKSLHTGMLRGRIVLAFAGLMLAVLGAACNNSELKRAQEEHRAQEKKARDESKRMLDAMHKDADAAIRKYTDGQTQAGKTPAAKEKKQ
jgi:hypothetical protein